MKNDNLKNQYRVNEQIRAAEVRIVGDDIESVVMPTHKALALAEEKELDLVDHSHLHMALFCLFSIRKLESLYQNTHKSRTAYRATDAVTIYSVFFPDDSFARNATRIHNPTNEINSKRNGIQYVNVLYQ